MKHTGKKLNIYLKAGMWAMFAEILIRAVSFLSTPVFSRILPMDVYGDVKTFESWLSILTPLLSLGLYTNIEVAPYQFREKYKPYVSSVMFLIILIHTVIFAVSMLLRTWICRIMDFSFSMLVITILYCCFYSCIICQLRMQRIQLDYKSSSILSALASVPSLLISIACCMISSGATNAELLDIRIVSFYAPVILLGMVVTVTFLFQQKTFVNLSFWQYALKVSIPLIMYQISLQILTQSDRIMIKNMVSSEKAAIYSIATTIIYIIEIIHKAFASAWTPWLFDQLDKKNYKTVNTGMYLVLAGFGILVLGTLLFGSEIVFIFGGKSYMEAKWVLGPMLGGVIFQVLMLKMADIEKFFGKENYVGIISIIVVIFNLTANYFGILYGGYRIAAYTTMVSYMAAVLIHFYLARKKLPKLQLSYLRYFLICLVIGAAMILLMGLYLLPAWVHLSLLAALILAILAGTYWAWKKYGSYLMQNK